MFTANLYQWSDWEEERQLWSIGMIISSIISSYFWTDFGQFLDNFLGQHKKDFFSKITFPGYTTIFSYWYREKKVFFACQEEGGC